MEFLNIRILLWKLIILGCPANLNVLCKIWIPDDTTAISFVYIWNHFSGVLSFDGQYTWGKPFFFPACELDD